MKRKLLFLLTLLTPIAAFAQEGSRQAAESLEHSAFVFTAPHFFVAIIAGLILAAAFQVLLTNLSLAAGLSMTGAAVSPDTKNKKDNRDNVNRKGNENVMDRAQSTARTITNAFGIWTLITAALSLFFASWLAVKVSGTFSVVYGALLGLVIWGLFTVLMVTLEVSAVTSLLGSLIHTARKAFRTAYETTASMFKDSPEEKAADTAKEVAAAVREELLGGQTLKDQMREYLGRIQSTYSPEKIRKQLEKLLDSTEIDYIYREGANIDENRVIASIQSGGLKPEEARSAFNSIKEAARIMGEEKSKGKGATEKVVDTALRMTGASSEQAEEYRTSLEEHLRNTGKEELNPDAIKRDLERLFSQPREGVQALRERASKIDRSTVAAVLEERTDMNRDEARRIADQVVNVTKQIAGTAKDTSFRTESATGDMKNRVEGKLRQFINSLGEPDLQYEDIKHDMQRMFSDPKGGGESLLNRLRSVDRETIKAMLQQGPNMSEERAEELVRRVEEARDSVIETEQSIIREAQRRLEQARIEAQHQAEEAAKTAATAAWWAFITAVVSGAAAALGGMFPAM